MESELEIKSEEIRRLHKVCRAQRIEFIEAMETTLKFVQEQKLFIHDNEATMRFNKIEKIVTELLNTFKS